MVLAVSSVGVESALFPLCHQFVTWFRPPSASPEPIYQLQAFVTTVVLSWTPSTPDALRLLEVGCGSAVYGVIALTRLEALPLCCVE